MAKIYKGLIRKYFRSFGKKVIKLKYFVMVVGAMLFEIATLVIYIIKNKNILELDIFTSSILYGVSSMIMIGLAIVGLMSLKIDRTSINTRIRKLSDFKEKYYKLSNKYSESINDLLKDFNSERSNIEEKIAYSELLADKYDKFSREFSEIEVTGFLNNAYNYELEHLFKEKLLFTSFASFVNQSELEKITRGSNLAHDKFLKELDMFEQKLKKELEKINTGNLSSLTGKKYC